MNKWEKVVRLHRLLASSRYPAPKDAILRELECSEATFHRVRAFLCDTLGAPLAFDQTRGGYCYRAGDTENRFELPGLWFSADELSALMGFDQAMESLQQGYFSELFHPLRSRLEKLLSAQRIRLADLRERIKIVPIQSCAIDAALFRTIAGAVIRRRRLRIRHAKLTDDAATQRVISPQTLVRYRDNWYVDAYCHTRNGLRTFALERIKSAERAPGRALRVAPAKLRAFFADSYGIFTGKATNTAEIIFRGPAGRIAESRPWHPHQQGRRTADGAYIVRIPYAEDRELLMDILRWGADAEVVSPPELRQKAAAMLASALRNYEKNI